MNPASFLNYSPVPLAFGTSGLRGLVKDITDLEAYINVKASLRFLLSIGDIRANSVVVIAGDLRPSTDRIMRACAQAVIDSNCQVENAGKIPTPALISHAIAAGCAGVMVSGSHIPFDRNGIKLSKSAGEILKSDEPGIRREIERVRVEEYSRSAATSAFDASGRIKQSPELPPPARAAEETYVRRYMQSFTGSDIALTSGTLIALPTRDSTLPILANLFAAAEQRIALRTLWSRLPARFGRAGLIDNVPIAVSQAILARLIPPGDVIEVEFDGTHVFDRSNPGAMRTPLAEPAATEWEQRKAMLARFFMRALGFDDIARINVLDGVRVYFYNGDIAHMRPSGNAPQLRIYANSDSQARADQIVELALREPDGILRQLERAFMRTDESYKAQLV